MSPFLYGQIDPVKWECSSRQLTDNEFELEFTAKAEGDWHVYSQFMEPEGPMPTHFTIGRSKAFSTIGKVKELSKPIIKKDSIFLMDVIYFNSEAKFTQRIRLKVPSAVVNVRIDYMACNGVQCLAPQTEKFNVQISCKPKKAKLGKSANDSFLKPGHGDELRVGVTQVLPNSYNTISNRQNELLPLAASDLFRSCEPDRLSNNNRPYYYLLLNPPVEKKIDAVQTDRRPEFSTTKKEEIL